MHDKTLHGFNHPGFPPKGDSGTASHYFSQMRLKNDKYAVLHFGKALITIITINYKLINYCLSYQKH